MTKFAGWVGSGAWNESAVASLTELVGRAGSAFDFQYDGHFGLASQAPALLRDDGILLFALKTAASTEHLREVLARYRRHGAALFDGGSSCDGVVLIDSVRRLLLAATDPIGLSHIYYAVTDSVIVFGSSADFVVRHPAVESEISAQAIYDYVYYHHCPSPNTIYTKVKKLEGGQQLSFEDGKLELRRYWLPSFNESALDLRQVGEDLKAGLIETVRGMVGSGDDTGAFLSGGLDSSSVAGALAKVFPGKAKTFSMGFPVEGYNEIEYANIAVKHFNTRQHEYYVTPEDTVNAVPMIAAYYDEPFGNSSALAAYYCAKLAKDNGVGRLLAGDGGDEIFAGNERYAKQMLFEHYHRLPRAVGAGLEGVLNALPAGLANTKLPFKAKRYIEQAKAAMPDRLQDYNFLHRHTAADIFVGDFLAQIDTGEPLQLLRDNYRRPDQASTLNRMLYMDWKATLHDNDLVKVNRMCELAGVEVCYPLLDSRIVELSCQIPSAAKLHGQKLRWFYKQAMADFLPDAIINKSKHGFGLPFGIWLKDHQPLKDLAYDAINALKKRGYFKPEFLDHAIAMHQSIHAAYYGELIWILMMLELWFAGKQKA
ncbi:asparagine synthetase B family protein [Methylomonas sp. MS20]|uniref:asparagine synthetase B family protein n=1 Tax=unclassified Methylomonas TaxID=2608980 RepID=UPI0028A462B5|nr:asparagine synthase-related protein [Methylomonas sp. MV1]MDT4332303.1 asparagine synthase-related protein [Methylomonas sp. MV1]